MDVDMLLEIENLRYENTLLKAEKIKLQEDVGRWRRFVQEKRAQPEYLKERHDQGRHFIDVVINDIPADLVLKAALLHIKKQILPLYHAEGYYYHATYRSRKYGWVVTLARLDDTDMRLTLK
jgi:hypothetical protein